MLNIKQSGFLQDKITHIQTAMLHCPDEGFFNSQAVMAHVLKLDEKGHLWLSVNKPVDCIDAGSRSFDIVLNCYNHSQRFEFDILGEAQLLTIAVISNIPSTIKKEHKQGKMILQVEILDFDYREHKPRVFSNIAKKIRYMFHGSHTIATHKQELYPNHQMSA